MKEYVHRAKRLKSMCYFLMPENTFSHRLISLVYFNRINYFNQIIIIVRGNDEKEKQHEKQTIENSIWNFRGSRTITIRCRLITNSNGSGGGGNDEAKTTNQQAKRNIMYQDPWQQ